MQRIMRMVGEVDWGQFHRDVHFILNKLIRTRPPRNPDTESDGNGGRGRQFARCLNTFDLTSLGVGSCAGTGMYLVTGLVARRTAGPAVVLSFLIAAFASLLSGLCYAEFGVRVPNTTGSAYAYCYVTMGEFMAFSIGWNMMMEYLIGTSACARALSACVNTMLSGAIERFFGYRVGTLFGKPPDVLASLISLSMTMILLSGVRKSLAFNNVLNGINLTVWVFIMTTGLFYMNEDNWTEHRGFLPFGWNGVLTGAATCFYAFIGFDIIATTGEEANNPRRSIPLSIVFTLLIVLIAYVSSSLMLTLVVPYDKVDPDSGLVQMFGYVQAPTCKCIVAMGAIAGLTVSMFGSMFPMPRIMYAMAQDGLIYRPLAHVSEKTGAPTNATFIGGIATALVSLMIQLDVLVEMMSIGTLLAYCFVSVSVLVLRFQPNQDEVLELMPARYRSPMDMEHGTFGITSQSQHVMVRRFTRSSPDSDESIYGDDSDEFGRDDSYLMRTDEENNFYGAVSGGPSAGYCSRFFNCLYRQLHASSYLCPSLCPWVQYGPPTEASGKYVIKAVSVMLCFIVMFNLFAVYGSPGSSNFTLIMMILLFLCIVVMALLISRKPQNRTHLIYYTPWVPFVPTAAITINVYLILNLSGLTLVRFAVWMLIGLIVYFKYGIKNSTLENPPAPRAPTPPPTRNTTAPIVTQPIPIGDRNIFEGDRNTGMFGTLEAAGQLLTWHETNYSLPTGNCDSPSTMTADEHLSATVSGTLTHASGAHGFSGSPAFKQVESRYNARTNSTTSHTSSRPPWANPDASYGNWDD